jgi:hypothetical protein
LTVQKKLNRHFLTDLLMKQITFFIMAGFMLCLFVFSSACKSAATETTATVEPPVELGPIPSADYKAILVKYDINSYPAWKEDYMAHDAVRKSYGVSSEFIGRGTDDTNTVLVMNRMTDILKGKEFITSPDLKSTMKKAGITGLPVIALVNVVRDDTSAIPINDRVIVAHKVKDYDAWLKVYDGEGRSMRAENGLLDRGLAREIDDPTMVYIVFAITDKAKAMARMQSEELKKVMTDAGVEGPPSFFYYTLQP